MKIGIFFLDHFPLLGPCTHDMENLHRYIVDEEIFDPHHLILFEILEIGA
jgi:hypothetical protein